MTNEEEAIKNLKKLKSFHNGSYGTAIDFAIKALEQQPCEDCISRAEALKVIEEQKKGFYGVERYAIDECHSAVMKLPSVTPKQKVGKWIDSNLPQEKYVCSECGGACWYYDYEGSVAKSKYCPNCGAKMEVKK